MRFISVLLFAAIALVLFGLAGGLLSAHFAPPPTPDSGEMPQAFGLSVMVTVVGAGLQG